MSLQYHSPDCVKLQEENALRLTEQGMRCDLQTSRSGRRWRRGRPTLDEEEEDDWSLRNSADRWELLYCSRAAVCLLGGR